MAENLELLTAPSLTSQDAPYPMFRQFTTSELRHRLNGTTRNLEGVEAEELLSYYSALEKGAVSFTSDIDVVAYIDPDRWGQRQPIFNDLVAIDWPLAFIFDFAKLSDEEYLQDSLPELILLKIKLPAGLPLLPFQLSGDSEYGHISFLSNWGLMLEKVKVNGRVWQADYGGPLTLDQESLFYNALGNGARRLVREHMLLKQLLSYEQKYPEDVILVKNKADGRIYHHDRRLNQQNFVNISQLLSADYQAMVIPGLIHWFQMVIKDQQLITAQVFFGHWTLFKAGVRPNLTIATQNDFWLLVQSIALGEKGYLVTLDQQRQKRTYRLPRVQELPGSIINQPYGISYSGLLRASGVSLRRAGYYHSLVYQASNEFSLPAPENVPQALNLISYQTINNCPCAGWPVHISYGAIRGDSEDWIYLDDWLRSADSTILRRLEVAWHLLQIIDNQVSRNFSHNKIEARSILIKPSTTGNWSTNLLLVNSNLSTDQPGTRQYLKFGNRGDVIGHPRVIHPYLQYMQFGRLLTQIFVDEETKVLVERQLQLYNSLEMEQNLTTFIEQFAGSVFARLDIPIFGQTSITPLTSITAFQEAYQAAYGGKKIEDLIDQHDSGIYLLLSQYVPAVVSDWYLYVTNMSSICFTHYQEFATIYRQHLERNLSLLKNNS